MKKSFSASLSGIFFVIFVCLCAAVLSGCCHAQVFTEPVPADTKAPAGKQAVAYGSARNNGYYLFNKYPLYTGHTYNPNRKDYHTFHDDIKPQVNAAMLLRTMKQQYKAEELADVEHWETNYGYFSLWIIWRKTITTTAIGVKSIKAEDAKK